MTAGRCCCCCCFLCTVKACLDGLHPFIRHSTFIHWKRLQVFQCLETLSDMLYENDMFPSPTPTMNVGVPPRCLAPRHSTSCCCCCTCCCFFHSLELHNSRCCYYDCRHLQQLTNVTCHSIVVDIIFQLERNQVGTLEPYAKQWGCCIKASSSSSSSATNQTWQRHNFWGRRDGFKSGSHSTNMQVCCSASEECCQIRRALQE